MATLPTYAQRTKKVGCTKSKKKPRAMNAIARRTKRGERNRIRTLLRAARSNPDTEIYAGRPSAFDTFSRHRLEA